MLAVVTFAATLVGASWVAEAYFDFRIESFDSLYPFDLATRQMAGIVLLAVGSLLGWWESRHAKKSLHA